MVIGRGPPRCRPAGLGLVDLDARRRSSEPGEEETMAGPTSPRSLGVISGILCAAQPTVAPLAAAAEANPTCPIRVIAPTDPGGAVDGLARAFQRAFEEIGVFAHSMAVVNMAGAGGPIGACAIKDADPDRHPIGTWRDGPATSRAMGVVDFDPTAFEIIGATGFADVGLAAARGGSGCSRAPTATVRSARRRARAAPPHATSARPAAGATPSPATASRRPGGAPCCARGAAATASASCAIAGRTAPTASTTRSSRCMC